MIINNFTKKELLKIHEACIFWFSNGYQGVLDEAKDLNIKIKNMIDNYCEHDYIPCNDMHRPAECTKCGDLKC